MLKHQLKERDVDGITVILNRLQSRDAHVRELAAEDLHTSVATLARELTSETFARFLSDLTPRLQSLLQSSNLVDQLGGISAVDALIPVASEAQIIRFANYLRSFFVTCESKAGLRAASWTLGRLASSTENGISGTLVAAFVDFEVKRAFEWLTNPCFQANHRRLAACMVLQALASAVPTLFHVNLTTFFVAIWPAIRDPRVDVRDAATDALAACLQLIAMRQTRHRVQWYCKIYDQVQDGLHVVKGMASSIGRAIYVCAPSVVVAKSPSWESIHGSLLVIGQLVQNTGSFMVPRFREVCDIVLCYKDAKDKLVARSVCLLLPQLAAYCPDAFVRHYLSICVAHLMKRVTTFLSVSERGIAFLALGELALAVGDQLVPQLPSIIELLQDGMKKSKYYCIETLVCAAHFTKACTVAMEPYLPSLLEQMLAGGLNDALVEALTEIIQTVPAVKTWVQERLLHEISLVLRRTWTRRSWCMWQGVSVVANGQLGRRCGAHGTLPGRGQERALWCRVLVCPCPAAPAADDVRRGGGFSTFSLPFRSEKLDDKDTTGAHMSDAMLLLSLKTLGQFDFCGPFSILPFVQDNVAGFLTYPDVAIRKQAVVTCAKLCHPDPALSKRGRSGHMIDQVLQTLLQVGLTDLDWTVRKSVVESLDPSFDAWLAQESHVNLLFYLVNDEHADIRELTMDVLDRLAGRNPAYILPLLRRVLIQLLTELDHALDLRSMEDSTRLLSKLIRGSQHLIEPYLSRVLDVLVPKLQLQGNANVASAVLTALGSLAQAVQTQMAPFEPMLLPLILDALQDHSSLAKRHVALVTLGQLTTSTGNVVQPYVMYPKVLHVLLDLLQHTAATPWSLRREAMKTMGILGALDPYKYKLCVARSPTLELPDKPLPSTMDEEKQQIELQLFTAPPVGTRRRTNVDVVVTPSTTAAAAEEDPMHLALQHSPAAPALSVSDDAYFPTVAIHALLGILREPSLAVHHYGVIQAIMFIFKSLSLQCVPFLPSIVPPFLHVLDKGEPRLRHSLFLQLTALTSIVQHHLSPFFPAMVTLILRHWRAHLSPILQLIEKLARAAPSDFKQTYFPMLLPRLLEVLSPQPSSHGSGIVLAPGTHPNEPTPPTPLHPTMPVSSAASGASAVDHGGSPGAIVADLEAPDNSGSGIASLQIQVVHVLLVCGPAVVDSVFVLMPALIRLLEHADTSWEAKTWIVGLLAHLTLLAPTFEHYIGPRLLLVVHRLLRLHTTTEKNRKFADAAVYLLGAIAFQLQDGWLSYKSLIESILPFVPSPDHVAAMQAWSAVLADDKRISKELVQQVLTPELKSWYTAASSSATPSPDVNPASNASAIHVNQANLKRAWEASQRSTKEDWLEWMRRFSIELLRESPSAALRSCCSLAQAYNPLARALFNSAFVSCWNQLFEQYQDYLVRALETAFQSDTIPAEILQTLLNLAEFMEHDVEALPIDIRELGELAQKCHAYAKALHYKELEFHTSPSTCIEALISINNQVGQPEAAVGILKYAQWHHRSVIQVKESWFEKLQDWENALELYNVKLVESPHDLDACTGKMRCLEALGEWEQLASLAKQVWSRAVDHDNASTAGKGLKKSHVDESLVKSVALLGARACWWLSEWTTMEQYVSGVLTSGPSVGTLAGTPSSVDSELNGLCALYKSVLAVHHNQFDDAQKWIDITRKEVDTTLGALVGESYLRAYHTMITLQQLSELEEIVAYKKICIHKPDEAPAHKRHMVHIWSQRLTGCKRVVEVWQHVLAVRSLVLRPHEDIDTWLQFASLCRQSGNLALSLKVFTHALSVRSLQPHQTTTHDDWRASLTPGPFSSVGYSENDPHRVAFAYLKHLWAVGDKAKALHELGSLVQTLSRRPSAVGTQELVKCQLKWAEWQMAIHDQQLDRVSIPAVLAALKHSTELDPTSYKAWHAWALMNFQVVDHQASALARDDSYVVSAIEGFFRSIALGRSRWAANVQQDILRVLTLWFAHGHKTAVYGALKAGFQSVNIETWLIVIPQLIARIHSPHERIQKQLSNLLCAIGAQHPHALIYPLSVALKSPLEVRQKAAEAIMDVMRRNYKNLVDEALLVSRELIRVAILWHEMWHEGLEEASRLYFGEHDVEGMMAVLQPLHVMMEKGPETLREVSFHQAFGRDLKEAYEWIQRYLNPQYGANEADLNRAWDLYYYVFRRINKQLPQLTTLELQYVSPNLLQAHNLQLAVPGTYRAGHDIIKIRSFVPTMLVLTSKQRPRRITIHASNGLEYMFLLKGHEDLRQDERVTQLFGLVNALLINDRTTSKKDLRITRYPVIPLSHNAGIVGWVPNCDTLHQLIRDYREARKILLNIEHRYYRGRVKTAWDFRAWRRLMLQMAPDYDVLTLMQKVEVFQCALENTAGQDLYKVLWLKSENSEIWLDRRTNYTRSLAAMSMVGYILGLGDRHPSNLMLHRFTGTIVHIDFGDCFEVAMHREKYPEKIPFRLTRMLTNAMEVSGIEGNFRFSCEAVMQVLRDNQHSLMAMLEAFVHDPLICWRLLAPNASPPRLYENHTDDAPPRRDRRSSVSIASLAMLQQNDPPNNIHVDMYQLAASMSRSVAASAAVDANGHPSISSSQVDLELRRSHRERELVNALGPEGAGAPREALNEKAVAVTRRVQSKLTGRDFFDDDSEPLNVAAQVQRLITQAASHENLCQCYIGWCPFW
ncbi:hypothetical protein, variant 2 [Aphanomyces invadans]|uniref:Serine/threonine-protein kinase TOR n=1 Tax=Aphanomyces invadans TaxID=157072 RepID=A0A024THF5_9STRA|nr:hypothetical protein, variant 2 [Aphanomyces invadans]ETV93394.1 hypothetical protein, variant 2 [Aphanomyces invadans]|eukprot:XP_008878037.1 hypothetical protein, variant 2 [Aphanomyces invadans]